jgi:ankyrin repeat protein
MEGLFALHPPQKPTDLIRIAEGQSEQGAALGSHYLVRRLLNAGADVDAQGSYYNEYTALSAATEGGHYEIVRMLLDAGADVAATSGNKTRTAAQIASFRGQDDIARLLIVAAQKIGMAQDMKPLDCD